MQDVVVKLDSAIWLHQRLDWYVYYSVQNVGSGCVLQQCGENSVLVVCDDWCV